MNSNSKFDSDVKKNDATHAPRGHERGFITHIIMLSMKSFQ